MDYSQIPRSNSLTLSHRIQILDMLMLIDAKDKMLFSVLSKFIILLLT